MANKFYKNVKNSIVNAGPFSFEPKQTLKADSKNSFIQTAVSMKMIKEVKVRRESDEVQEDPSPQKPKIDDPKFDDPNSPNVSDEELDRLGK